MRREQTASTPEAVKSAGAQSKAQRDADMDDVRKVMAMPEGRRVVWRWLAAARVFGRCYTGSSEETFYREGRREYGLQLFDEVLEACPDLYIQAIQERAARAKDSGNG